MGLVDQWETWPPYVRLCRWLGFDRPLTQVSRDWLLAKRHRVGLLCCVFFGLGSACAGGGPIAAVLLCLAALFLSHWLF